MKSNFLEFGFSVSEPALSNVEGYLCGEMVSCS